MSRIKSKNTVPELLVRQFLYENGLRYRVNYHLVGKPDIVFIRKRIAIFVHGCFWHVHGCKNSTTPKSNRQFWYKKLMSNKVRDKKIKSELKNRGWKFYTVWECELESKKDRTLGKLLEYISYN